MRRSVNVRSFNDLGWESSPDEDFLTSQLRSLLILTAGINGHEECV
jgi:hypothetical protein